jgi:hypothetical protein
MMARGISGEPVFSTVGGRFMILSPHLAMEGTGQNHFSTESFWEAPGIAPYHSGIFSTLPSAFRRYNPLLGDGFTLAGASNLRRVGSSLLTGDSA